MMFHRLKSKQAAIIAALAVGAAVVVVVASAGAHTPARFTFPKGAKEVKSLPEEPTEKAVQTIVVPKVGEAHCTGISYFGLPEGSPTTSIKLSPSFEFCEFLGKEYKLFRQACEFVFNANGTLSIVSENGGDCVKFPMLLTDEKAEDCQVTIPEQVRTGVTYTNIPSGKEEEVTAASVLKGLEGERSAKCAETGAFNNGEYRGNTILAGFEGATKKPMLWSATVP